jgi:hypothetical protein
VHFVNPTCIKLHQETADGEAPWIETTSSQYTIAISGYEDHLKAWWGRI